MKHIKKILILAIATLYLSACGGAVEGDGSTVVDTTAPNFILGDPPGDVDFACFVTAEFDDQLLAATVTDQSFKIQKTGSSQLTAADGTWGLSSSSNTIAEFIPSINLLGEYTVTLTTAITNTAGIHLATEKAWTFTTTLPCPP